ncbi:DNA methyltransferase [Priestia megaterium]|uniref:site-specific DNA-methyltransferase n=1 Tax=Priestia megaterium TaxID=1404 RepID=UPI003008B47C
MAAINDLIKQMEDKALRDRLTQEVDRITSKKKFGLVFEDHLPECTPIYGEKIKIGNIVARKGKTIDEIFLVVSIKEDIASCLQKTNGAKVVIPVNELVIVAQFGQPIFPALIPMDKVKNTAEGASWHSLIEADNYHALQLLEYLYPKQVDCIYIDPPYNTGARDWRYNNDYVDRNDKWRHSKWLAFMKRRLNIAKRLLNPLDSVLILAIDDNELFYVGLLLDEIFKGCERQIINITINPKGKAREGRLSQVDEYLIVVYVGGGKAQELISNNEAEEIRWPYLRRSDVESARGTKKGGVRQFYPIYVNEISGKIVHVGEPLTPDQSLDCVPNMEGAIAVFPIREDGKHMNWGLTGPSLKKLIDNGFVRVLKSSNEHQAYNFSYITLPSVNKVNEGIYHVSGTREDGTKIVVIPGGKPKKVPTVWSKNLYDANAYGSQVLGELIPGKKFPFPKSIYAVKDSLKTFVGNKSDALILDFFAGSGTTLHAVNLLNAEDGGNRRCILVTNNEVSEDEANSMKNKGYQPGDFEWEKQGICQSVTWPRTKNSILGKREDETFPEGIYYTDSSHKKTKKRSFFQLSFSSSEMLETTAKKKQLVSLLGKENLPQSLVTSDSKYIISEKHKSSILFDDKFLDDWVSALDEQRHITKFYIVTANNTIFKNAKKMIADLLGDITLYEPIKIPMSDGFKANVEYFKLAFLDKNSIALGQQFREILPILWLKSGAVGERIELPVDTELPSMLIPKLSNFAILIDESYFAEFNKQISEANNLTHIYIVTNSEEAFREMASQIKVKNVTQLYRDYIDNFVINSRRV